jgi:hypothetical protein
MFLRKEKVLATGIRKPDSPVSSPVLTPTRLQMLPKNCKKKKNYAFSSVQQKIFNKLCDSEEGYVGGVTRITRTKAT